MIALGRAFVGVAGETDRARTARALDEAATILVPRGAIARVETKAVDARVVGESGVGGAPASGLRAGRDDGGASVSVRWDEDGALDLVADRFGRRSLFVAERDGALAFSTDARALARLLSALGAPPTLDPRAIRRFYAFSCVPAPRSPWREIRAVPASHRARWATTLGPFTRAADVALDADPPDDEGAGALLRDAVLAASERAYEREPRAALLLSGGLDSALVGGGLARVCRGADALTIDLDEGSEVTDARAIADAFGLVHHKVAVDGDAVVCALDAAIATLDTPIGDPVVVPLFLAARAAASLGARALWNGEGGDQLFAGWQTKPMLAWARYAAAGENPSEPYLATFHKLAEVEGAALGDALRDAGDPPLEDDLRPLFEPERATRHRSFLHLLCEANLFSKGASNVAPRIDRVSAGAGVDAVSPLLDPAVVDASFRLHPTQKQRGVIEKWAVRAALGETLPAAIVSLPKRGMRVPLTTWLKGPLGELARDVLASRAFRERGHVRPAFAEALLAGEVLAPDLRRRRRDEWVWLLLAGELWMRAHGARG